MTFRALTTLAAVALVGFGSMALAVDDPVKARQEKMKSIGDSMKLLGQMAKGEVDYDAARAETAVQTIHTSIQGFTELFPEGSNVGETEAAPKIWEDMDGFKTIAGNLSEASAAAAPVAAQGLDALKGALGGIGKNCKECHDSYRIKKS